MPANTFLEQARSILRRVNLTEGKATAFYAHNRTFYVRPVAGSRGKEFVLTTDHEKRARFGTLDEIRADAAYCLECGSLPPRIDGAF